MRNHREDEEEAEAIRCAGEGITAESLTPTLSDVAGGKSGRRKKRGLPWIIRKLKFNKESLKWRWKFLSSAFKSKRIKIVDDVLFRIASVLEAIALVATVAFFYLCCGCNF
ncbi:hypothetical protein LINPERPRIM_LOCUS18289 [Linum perenne]